MFYSERPKIAVFRNIFGFFSRCLTTSPSATLKLPNARDWKGGAVATFDLIGYLASILGALDHLTLGVILVDRAGSPLWHNRRAREIMDRSDGLRLSTIGLVGPSPADTRLLRELITAAVLGGAKGVLAMNRGPELRPLLLIASPLKPIDAPDLESGYTQFARGVIFVSDPHQTDEPNTDALKRAYSLTHREAQTAIAVARGQGLKAAADAMGVAPTTARTQLQQVFAKTGTSQQAELAALVHRTLMHVRHDS